MRILTIDPGTHVGWAFNSPDLRRPIFGSKDFSSFAGVDGRVHSHYLKWLHQQMRNSQPDVIVIESPFFRGQNSEFLFGFFNLTALAAFEGSYGGQRPVLLERIHLAHAKKHMTGKGNADKEEVIAAVRQLGFAVVNDHEADALALLHFKLANTANNAPSPGKTVSLRPRVLNRHIRRKKGAA